MLDTKTPKRYLFWVGGLVLLFPFLFNACTQTAVVEISCDPNALLFDDSLTRALPSPPNDTTNVNCAWDTFAWNTFAALNWPADTLRRGFPDTSATRSFINPGGNGVEGVWESFKEKREVFQSNPNPVWNDEEIQFPPPQNLWPNNGGYCTAEEEQMANKPERGFVLLTKFHHNLDETVEVASEALEPDSTLCKGHNPDCNVNGRPVGPRVWKGMPSDSTARPVYYEVKVNYDFFEYVFDFEFQGQPFPLYDDHNAVTSALLGRIQLPVRAAYSLADSTKGFPTQNPGIDSTAYDPQACLDVYQDPTAQTPCKVGSIHTKSAWIQMAEEDTSTYHTTRAIYYKATADSAEAPICMSIGTFGMIGLHIIQRVHIPRPGGDIGGAFVFATWEHNDIIKADGSSDYRYVNFRVDVQTDSDTLTAFPTLDNAIEVSRMMFGPEPPNKPADCTLSQPQTCLINEMAHTKLAGSVWENYQLIGTQFRPVGSKTESNQIAQPFYLANLVIETNEGLQHFQGVPPLQPRLQPPQWCAKYGAHSQFAGDCEVDGTRLVSPAEGFGFQRDFPNVTFGGAPYNMGGCQGCHGVAQQDGYAFSFVLLDGQGGALADTEEEENIPPAQLTHTIDLSIQSALGNGTKLALDLGPDSTVVINPADGSQQQQWIILPYYDEPFNDIFGGTYIIQNAMLRAQNDQLGILTASTGSDTLMVKALMPQGGGGTGIGAPPEQGWMLIPQGKASARTFFFFNFDSNHIIEVKDGSVAAGTPVLVKPMFTPPDTSAAFASEKGWTLNIPGASN